jgi:uridine kinase
VIDVGARESVPARLEDLAGRTLAAVSGLGPVRLVCIDGPAGSGKTSLADGLAGALQASGCRVAVIHLDDLYEGWSGLDGVWDRLEAQLLGPLGRGLPARWQRYDWSLGNFAEWHDLPVPDVLVLEGCGSAPRAVDGRVALRLFVEAPPEMCLSRGVSRDGEALRADWVRWQAVEATQFAIERTRERADLVIDGTVPFS